MRTYLRREDFILIGGNKMFNYAVFDDRGILISDEVCDVNEMAKLIQYRLLSEATNIEYRFEGDEKCNLEIWLTSLCNFVGQVLIDGCMKQYRDLTLLDSISYETNDGKELIKLVSKPEFFEFFKTKWPCFYRIIDKLLSEESKELENYIWSEMMFKKKSKYKRPKDAIYEYMKYWLELVYGEEVKRFWIPDIRIVKG
jgi:hypothetical protein